MCRSMGGLRRLRVFVGFVMADCAACGSTQYAMMTREMPSGTTDHGALEAALRVGGNRRNGDMQVPMLRSLESLSCQELRSLFSQS